MTTKILALTDALGNLVRFRLMPGQRHDSVEAGAMRADSGMQCAGSADYCQPRRERAVLAARHNMAGLRGFTGNVASG